MSYKPVGGVRSVSLHAANAVGINREGLVVELAEDRSSYVERLRVDDGVVVVEHTLLVRFGHASSVSVTFDFD